jgi:hypothetical protein
MTINDTVNVDSDFRKLALEPIVNNHILLIVLLVRKNLKTLKLNGVPALKQNYPQ